MNQLDWEKMKEDISITNVERVNSSSWFTAQSEYTVNAGNSVNGTYIDTQTINDQGENFTEAPTTLSHNPSLDIDGTFAIDISTYPLAYVQTIEIQMRYRASDAGDTWYLKAYNWSSSTYNDSGFNSTAGQTPTTGWNYYVVNLTNKWRSYVQDNGTIYVKFMDEGADSNQTTIDIDFLGVRADVDGACFTFKNEGPLTSQLVSLWIINSTIHQHYNINVFVNSADTETYLRVDIPLPNGQYTVKVVTELGNEAVYSGS
jgi:hypothetical protein